MDLALPQARQPRANRAFTLIELLVTIVIVGILAVMAVPRVVDLTGDAHRASVAATAASLQSGIRLSNIGCRIADFAGQDDLGIFGSGDLDFNDACYPVSTSNHNS